MRVRALLIGTALVSTLLGAVVTYLVLTVPNDIAAAQLMKKAKSDIDGGRNDAARESLSRIVQQYPRTDAAAAATVALVKLADSDRAKLAVKVDALQRDVLGVSTKVTQMAAAPPPAPPAVEVKPEPAPEPAPAKKKPTVHKSRSRHRRRRR